MRRRILCSLICLATAFAFFQTRAARATTIDPLIWQQLVLGADFVGVVQCETAGGIVARYKVVESWKGAPAGTVFTVRMAVNFWGPQFPVTLAGERYLMTAFKAAAPTRISSTTLGSPVPLWWRRIPYDYSLPLWQGRTRLPLSRPDKPLSELGSKHADLAEFKKAVDELLSLGPEAREVRLLQALAEKYLFSRDDEGEDAAERAMIQRVKLAQPRIQNSASARAIAAELVGLVRKDSDWRYSLRAVLGQGGGAATLEYLKGLNERDAPWKAEEHKELIQEVEERLRAASGRMQGSDTAEGGGAPSEKALAELRKALAAGPTSREFGQAFEVLTRHDPAPVAEFLKNWVGSDTDWQTRGFGYTLGSYFGWRCVKDRAANLRTLLKAHDPHIRVAGAVYLSFEDSDAGMAALRELTALPGDAGVWAALNLARRGEKEAVPRALEVLGSSDQPNDMSSMQQDNLSLRLLVLLSNSAAASGLAQPGMPAGGPSEYSAEAVKKYADRVRQHYVEWWAANRDRVQLSDPWLKTLEAQKVD